MRPAVLAEAATRDTFAGLETWQIVLWYSLIAVSVAIFFFGVARLVLKYRRGRTTERIANRVERAKRAARIVAASVLALVSVFAIDAGRYLVFRSHAFAGEIDGTGFYAQDGANGGMLRYLTDAPPGIMMEKIYDEFPRDTGIYGSFAQKPNLVGLPFVLEVWKKDLPELRPLVGKIESFYAGTLLDAARFLTDHDVRYVVWSVRESKDIEAWKSIMQAIDADYRWMEFSTTPDTRVGLWIRR